MKLSLNNNIKLLQVSFLKYCALFDALSRSLIFHKILSKNSDVTIMNLVMQKPRKMQKIGGQMLHIVDFKKHIF